MSSSKLVQVKKAVEVVSRGGIVIYPTDTLYGIGCDPFSVDSVKRVFEIKRREPKPMPVLIPDIEMLYRVAEPAEHEIEAGFKLWPGPVTILMKKRRELPDLVTAGEQTVGVRIPGHLIPLTIMQETNKPLVGTSANISGQPSAQEIGQIDPSILEAVDAVVDGGPTFYNAPSTVIKVSLDGFEVIREGATSRSEIARRLGF
ncbi:MAG: L-threonylcarbamoyladenylate synthase [Candidatus Caldarchaeum sp.]